MPPEPVEASQEPGPGAAPTKIKTFVLDTNVLLHNPKSIFVFQDNDIVLPFPVLEELDGFKGVNDDVGRNARECIRYLDALRRAGNLSEGVKLGNGEAALKAAIPYAPSGTLRIDTGVDERPSSLAKNTPDNQIITVAWRLHQQGSGWVAWIW